MWIESVQITSNTSVFGNLASYRTLPQPGEEKETLTRQLFRLLTEEKLIHFELWSSDISSYPPLYPPPLSSPLQVPGRGDRRSSAGGRTRSANSSLILRAVADAHRSVTSSKRTSAHLQQEEHSSSSSKGKKPKVGVTRDT